MEILNGVVMLEYREILSRQITLVSFYFNDYAF